MPEPSPSPSEAPEGAAVFPLIPAELGVHPLLLAALHAYVFLNGSDPAIVHPAAAEEALHYLVTYFQRLHGPELRRVREDMATLAAFAKAEKWPAQQVRFLREFLAEHGIGQ
ncbi:MAG: hypothetical protein RMJ56_01515 [Gemmataceae bacterium]|nr:hypothetical protein [Gemmata sp.]MDW8196260.1 hypothetical protein [Gemmataceae bacterium]